MRGEFALVTRSTVKKGLPPPPNFHNFAYLNAPWVAAEAEAALPAAAAAVGVEVGASEGAMGSASLCAICLWIHGKTPPTLMHPVLHAHAALARSADPASYNHFHFVPLCSPGEIRELFEKHGRVNDVYLPSESRCPSNSPPRRLPPPPAPLTAPPPRPTPAEDYCESIP